MSVKNSVYNIFLSHMLSLEKCCLMRHTYDENQRRKYLFKLYWMVKMKFSLWVEFHGEMVENIFTFVCGILPIRNINRFPYAHIFL